MFAFFSSNAAKDFMVLSFGDRFSLVRNQDIFFLNHIFSLFGSVSYSVYLFTSRKLGLFHVQGPVRVKAIMRIKTKKGNQGYFRYAEQRKLVDKNFSLCTYVSHDAASEIPGVIVFSLGVKVHWCMLCAACIRAV